MSLITNGWMAKAAAEKKAARRAESNLEVVLKRINY
jgi:hypothetical protein